MKKLFLILLSLCISISLFARPPDHIRTRIFDDAGLLTAAEITALEGHAEKIASRYHFDLVIVTKTTIDGADPLTYADDFFDNNGFGLREEGDGCLFLLVTNDNYSGYGYDGRRDFAFSTSGRAIKIYNTYALDTLEKKVLPQIKNRNMSGAANSFLNISEDIFALNEKGRGYNFFHLYHIQSLIVAWLVSIAVGIYCLIYFKKQMNTLIPAKEAENYMTSAGLAVTQNKDRFLFSTVKKFPRVDKAVAKGAVRMASSGARRGGSSRRF